MKAKSCFSTNMDPYRAGIEVGEALAEIEPEVIFLFPTIHYQGSPELVEAIYDVLENDNLALIGNTGDGFYERHKVAGVGVSALGINSGGQVKWHVAHTSGLAENPFAATQQCLETLHKSCQEGGPTLYFLAADFRTDVAQVIAALQEKAQGPVVGGLAGDDDGFEACFVYANQHVLTDSIALLAMEGAVAYDIHMAHNLQPVGRAGQITQNEGTTVQAIDNIPAMDFIRRELGKPLSGVDKGIITFKLMEEADGPQHQIRSLLLPDDDESDSEIKLFGSVETGNYVQICLAPPEKVIQDVKHISQTLQTSSFEPVAGLVVSCAGRKRVLADNLAYEVQEIVQSGHTLQGLAGYPSFGEIGPVKQLDTYSDTLFHNMTFILLLIGEAN